MTARQSPQEQRETRPLTSSMDDHVIQEWKSVERLSVRRRRQHIDREVRVRVRDGPQETRGQDHVAQSVVPHKQHTVRTHAPVGEWTTIAREHADAQTQPSVVNETLE